MLNIKNKIKECIYASILIPFILYNAYMMGQMSNQYKRLMLGFIMIGILFTYLFSFTLRSVKFNSEEEELSHKYQSLIKVLLECSFIISFVLTIFTILYFTPYLLEYLPNIYYLCPFSYVYLYLDITITLILMISIIICFMILIYDSFFNIYHINNHINIKSIQPNYHSPLIRFILNKGYFYRYSTPE